MQRAHGSTVAAGLSCQAQGAQQAFPLGTRDTGFYGDSFASSPHSTAGDSFASSPHSTSAGQLAESFTPTFRASFQLVADLKVFAQAPKSLTEALLYAPAVGELDDAVSNAAKRQ